MPEPHEPQLPEDLVQKGYSLELYQDRDAIPVAGLMTAYFKELGLELDPASLDKDIDDPQKAYVGGGLLVLKHHGEAVGCGGVLRLEPGVGELKRMYLAPDHRGGGLGRALLEGAISLARELGFKSLRLDTRLELKAANRLYEKTGFQDIEAYNQNPRAQRFMVLSL